MYFVFLKGGTAKILALMAQELTASSATFSAIIYSPTFFFLCTCLLSFHVVAFILIWPDDAVGVCLV